MSKIEVGERIRLLREKNCYSQEELAKRANITKKFLYEIEHGRKGFSAEVLYALSNALSASCDYLLKGEVA